MMSSSNDALSSMRAFIHSSGSSTAPQDPINPNPNKRKRNLPGNPDPDAEVIALSPKSLMATNRFVCEICNKGFQRDQNLQLHRRGHNLPWKLKQRNSKEVVKKKVYICPEKSCVHHDPSRALGDLTGIKKHFSRKHGEKKWKCEKCSKKYAVQSDWKAHSKICGTREYKCDCGTLFSRKDSFITHRAFCDALAEESARFTSVPNLNFRNDLLGNTAPPPPHQFGSHVFRHQNDLMVGVDAAGSQHHQLGLDGQKPRLPLWLDPTANSHHHHGHHHLGNVATEFLGSSSGGGGGGGFAHELLHMAAPGANMLGLSPPSHWFHGGSGSTSSSSLPPVLKEEDESKISSMFYNHLHEAAAGPPPPPAHMSATALLQKAAQMGSTRNSNHNNNNNNSQLFGSNEFGFVGSTISVLDNFNSRNEVHHHHPQHNHHNLGKHHQQQHDHHHHHQSHHMNASSMTVPIDDNRGNDHHGLLLGDISSSPIPMVANVENSSSPHDPLQGGNKGKHLNNHTMPSGSNSEVAVEGSLTRDFLGVGGHESRPFFQTHDLPKFSSPPTMPLSDYSPHT
ncbi:unnamed protein product [Cuscuta campestris]|uniref:C2H2-type domain-containing protein n=1 Tax=Cuscuta campestris TaxID=132261 RepID=A0A484M8F4_9ASTE|nr:unnamed protein product [Cuscuta campestris]